MRIDRVWCMPNKWTFTIKPIKQLIKEEMGDTEPWIDPFAGLHSPSHYRNDLNPKMNAQWHMDAIEFLDEQLEQNGEGFFAGCFIDAPYSPRQFKECYEAHNLKAPFRVFNDGYLADCRKRLALLVKAGGKAISCAWNSNGVGKKYGFEIERVLLVSHGSGHNDTIVTVERKIQHFLQ